MEFNSQGFGSRKVKSDGYATMIDNSKSDMDRNRPEKRKTAGWSRVR